MQTFNITRFRNTLLMQLADRKRIVVNFAAIGFLFAIVPALTHIVFNFHDITPMDWSGVAYAFCMIMAAYVVTCGAFIVGNLSGKNSRISTFLLPASKLEKFVSRYVFLLIAVPLAAVIGLMAGDIIQMPFYKIFSGETSSLTYAFIRSLSGIGSTIIGAGGVITVTDYIDSFFILLLAHSLYLLLGTFFRRHAWIKSNVLLFATIIVISMVVLLSTKAILDAVYGNGNYILYLMDGTVVDIIFNVVALAFTVFNYWAAFRIYSRMQAVNNKWYNF